MSTQNQNRTEDLNQEEAKNTSGGGLLGGGSSDGMTSVLHGGSLDISNSNTDEDGNSSSTGISGSVDSLLYNQND